MGLDRFGGRQYVPRGTTGEWSATTHGPDVGAGDRSPMDRRDADRADGEGAVRDREEPRTALR